MNIIRNPSQIEVNHNYDYITQQKKINLTKALKDDDCARINKKIIERDIVEYKADISDWKKELLILVDKLQCYDLLAQLKEGEKFKANDKLFEIIKTAIIKSARLKDKKITKILLNYFQEKFPNKKLLGFNNPLYHAICANDLKMVDFLLKEGFYTNELPENEIKYSHQLIPLNKAAAIGNLNILKLLLSKEKQLNNATYDYKIPLFTATRYGHIKTMELLLKQGAQANSSIAKKTPLYQAALRGNLEAVKLLLDFGADPNCRFYGEGTAVYVAAKHGHTDIVKILLTKKTNRKLGDPNAISCGKDTPIYAAVDNNDLNTVKVLLDAGADPNAFTTGENNPCYLAKKHNNKTMLLLLTKSDRLYHY